MRGILIKLWDASVADNELSIVFPLGDVAMEAAGQVLAELLLPSTVGRETARHVRALCSTILAGNYDYSPEPEFGGSSGGGGGGGSGGGGPSFNLDEEELDVKQRIEDPDLDFKLESLPPETSSQELKMHTANLIKEETFDQPESLDTPADDPSGCMAFLKVKIGDTETVRQTNKKVYQCDIENCGEQFPFKVSLQRHHRMKHNELFCTICLKAFQHSHICQRPHKCDVCGRGFSQTTILKKHMLIHTGEKPHVCETCGKKCRQLSSLQSHQRIHKLRESLPCDQCTATFLDEKALKHHKMIHTGEVAHICEVCSQTFSTRTNLKTHLKRFHSGKGIHCKVCNKKFVFERELTKHMAKHSETRSFVCELCSVAFYHKEYLDRHRAQVHGEKKFVCEICNSAYSTTWYLTRHMKSHKNEVRRINKTPAKKPSAHSAYRDPLIQGIPSNVYNTLPVEVVMDP